MTRLTLNMMMSLDGYAAGPEQSPENPFGIGGMQLTEWIADADQSFLEARFENVGATVMGRNMFGGGPGPWGDAPWKGYWGPEPPYHHPVFVLTNHAREPLEMEGGTTFYFVTDGIEAALEQAKEAAAGKDVSLGGGAATVQQYLRAGLVDDVTISLAPVFLGRGARLFDALGENPPKLEQVEVIEAPGVTHISYRVG
jgi:dihydrofolate reductase